MAMKRFLFTHVRVFDGGGAAPFAADVLVEDERIAAIRRGGEGSAAQTAGLTVIDGNGATLMPGLVEAHAHCPGPARWSASCRA
jgi:N-acyl-D-aspartate/D-glutamate deacylase